MPSYDKAACEVCGEMISQFPPAKARHMNEKHSAQPAVPTPVIETPVAEAPKNEKPMPVTDDVEVQKLMLLAKATQERLLNAPNLVVAEQTSDEMKVLRSMYCPESFNRPGKPATKHVFFGKTIDMAKLATRGYMPVIDPVKRRPVVWEELTMFWTPIEIFKAREAASQQASRDILGRAQKSALLEQAKDTTGEGVSSKGMEIEEFSITNKDVGG